MNRKEKIIFGIMILFFLLSTIMFCYQTIYRSKLDEASKVETLMAKADIGRNEKLTEENVEWIKVDKNLITDNSVLKQDKALGEKASEKIFKGELITKKRILTEKENTTNEFNTYEIKIVPDFATDLKEGDLIKVYAQILENDENKNEKIKNVLVFDKKEIVEVQSSNDWGNVTSIKVRVTDKEALSYYNAKQSGTIIVLKYDEDIDNVDYSIPYIDITK